MKRIENQKTSRSLNFYLKHEILPIIVSIAIAGYFILGIFKLFVSPEIIDSCFKILLTFVNLVLAGIGLYRALKLRNSSKYFGILLAMAGQLLVMITMIVTITAGPALLGVVSIADTALVSLGCFFMFLDLVKYHNEIVMRQPPHLNKRGGDEIADIINSHM